VTQADCIANPSDILALSRFTQPTMTYVTE
jgi:hypothetical protein